MSIFFMVVASWDQPRDNYVETGLSDRDREQTSGMITNSHRISISGYTYQLRFKVDNKATIYGYQAEIENE